VPAFALREEVLMHGQVWTFNIFSTPAFDSSAANDQPTLVLFSGLCLDAMLFVMFWLMSRSNRQV
jgi:hypothetical protein